MKAVAASVAAFSTSVPWTRSFRLANCSPQYPAVRPTLWPAGRRARG